MRKTGRPGNARPNIVVILADDMGFGDVRCYNPDSRIPTPNIDALALRGTRWTDMHTASAVCTPSRYGLLTGRYAWRGRLPYGVLYGYEPPLIGDGRETLGTRLQSAGYRTACIGKWHLGMGFHTKPGATVDFQAPLPWKSVDTGLEERIDFDAPLTHGPTTRGFDTFFGTAGCATAQPPYAFIENEEFVEKPTEFRQRIHFTGRPGMAARTWNHADADPTFVRRAVSQIEAYAKSSAPFFLYLAASAPHEPCLDSTVPEFARGKSEAGSRGDLVWLFDWMVGEVVAALERTRQAENTVVIVTSDNGALPGDRVRLSPGMAGYELFGHRSCGVWRGYKAHIWEGGHRVPFVIGPAATHLAAHHPTTNSHRGTGSSDTIADEVDATPACLTDLYRTLIRVAEPEQGARGTDAGAAEDSLDLSRRPSFARWLQPRNRGVADSKPPRRGAMVHHSSAGVYSARVENWKLVFECTGSGGWPPPKGGGPVPGSRGQLYDLAADPTESRNLYDEKPEMATELARLLVGFRAGRPTVGP